MAKQTKEQKVKDLQSMMMWLITNDPKYNPYSEKKTRRVLRLIMKEKTNETA